MKNFIKNLLPESEYRFWLQSDSPNLNLLFTLIEKRFIDLENKNKKPSETTMPQQLVLLKHLGMLDKILELKISKKNKAKLLSILLNRSADNIEGKLTNIRFDNDPELSTESNYKFLKESFEKLHLKKEAEQMDLILDKIYKRK